MTIDHVAVAAEIARLEAEAAPLYRAAAKAEAAYDAARARLRVASGTAKGQAALRAVDAASERMGRASTAYCRVTNQIRNLKASVGIPA